jgi:hypothetical protein
VRQVVSAVVVVVLLAAGGWLALKNYQASVVVNDLVLASGSGAPTAPPTPAAVGAQTRAQGEPSLPTAQVAFDPLVIDEAKLEAERATQRAQAQGLVVAQAPLLKALATQINAWGLRGEGAQAEQAALRLQRAAQAALEGHGEAGLALVVDGLRGEFEEALRAHMRADVTPPTPPTEGLSAWVSAVSVGALAVALRDVGLEVQPFAREVYEAEGLEALWPMVGVLFRYQWSQRLCGQGAPCLLTPYEEVTLRRWQVERSRASLAQKIKIIQRVRGEIPGYDWQRAEVILLAQAGMVDEARMTAQAALEQARAQGDDARAQALDALIKALR